MTIQKTVKEILHQRRRERASLIWWLRLSMRLTFREIGARIGQVKDPTKPMGIGHVVSIFKTEVRRRERLRLERVKSDKQRQEMYYHGTVTGRWKFPSIKEKVEAEHKLRKSLDQSFDQPHHGHTWDPDLTQGWSSQRYRKD